MKGDLARAVRKRSGPRRPSAKATGPSRIQWYEVFPRVIWGRRMEQRGGHRESPEESTNVPLNKELVCQHLPHRKPLPAHLRLLFHSNLPSLSFRPWKSQANRERRRRERRRTNYSTLSTADPGPCLSKRKGKAFNCTEVFVLTGRHQLLPKHGAMWNPPSQMKESCGTSRGQIWGPNRACVKELLRNVQAVLWLYPAAFNPFYKMLTLLTGSIFSITQTSPLKKGFLPLYCIL